jgi:hypothetical protein
MEPEDRMCEETSFFMSLEESTRPHRKHPTLELMERKLSVFALLTRLVTLPEAIRSVSMLEAEGRYDMLRDTFHLRKGAVEPGFPLVHVVLKDSGHLR